MSILNLSQKLRGAKKGRLATQAKASLQNVNSKQRKRIS